MNFDRLPAIAGEIFRTFRRTEFELGVSLAEVRTLSLLEPAQQTGRRQIQNPVLK
jgi:hypothetical protein